LRVGPGVDVARGDRHPQLGEEAVTRALDRLRIEIAVERLLEDALVDLDGVDAGGFGAAALPFEVIAEAGVVRVVARRREPVAEVSRRPVADAVLDLQGLHELDRLLASHVRLLRGGERELICTETGHLHPPNRACYHVFFPRALPLGLAYTRPRSPLRRLAPDA